jgi:hypothetical protein
MCALLGKADAERQPQSDGDVCVRWSAAAEGRATSGNRDHDVYLPSDGIVGNITHATDESGQVKTSIATTPSCTSAVFTRPPNLWRPARQRRLA